jgi:hemolysin III
LIAVTYTPFCLLGFDEDHGGTLLWIVWGGAAAGILQKVFLPRTPGWLSAIPYVLLGWAGFASMSHTLPIMAGASTGLLVAGGLVYTVGAVIYAMKRPDPLPRVFGYHEVFHALG